MSLPKVLLYRANRPALHFSPNDPIVSRSTGGRLEISSIKNQRTARVFIRVLAYFPEANLSSTSLPSILWIYSETFHQQPENLQRLFISSRKYSNTFWEAINSSNQQQQSTAAASSRNQQQQSTAATSSSNQQQQPAAALNSSNQQQQSTAAFIGSNQQQQPTSAINNKNQQQQPAFVLPAAPTQSTTTSVSFDYGS